MKSSVPKEYKKILKFVESKLGVDSTTNFELDKFAKKSGMSKYVGTFSSDQIPEMEDGESCIVNLDDSSKGGSHWVALYKDGDNLIVYDSFGRSSKKILKSVHHSGNGKVKDTDYDVEQKDEEDNCGQRSLSALIYCYKYGPKKLLEL